MSTELFSFLIGSGAIGSLLIMSIKRTWSDRDGVNAAYRSGAKSREDEHRRQMEELRSDLDDRLRLQAELHRRDIERLARQVRSLHEALTEIVPLVSPDRLTEAMEALARFSIPDPVTEWGIPSDP